MKNFHFTLLSLFVVWLPLQAQKLTVLTKTDSISIPYAHLIFYKNGKAIGGTYSNEKGIAFLDFNDRLDSIKISNILSKPAVIDGFNLPDSVYLLESKTILDEQLVYASSSSNPRFLGYRKKRKKSSWLVSTGIEIITLIPNSFKETRELGSFIFYLKKGKPNTSPELKIVFYKNNDGFPGTRLPYEKIVKLDSIKKGKVRVDFLSSHIIIPKEGVFAGIEWMGCIKDQNLIEHKGSSECSRGILCNKGQLKNTSVTYIREVFQYQNWENIDERINFPIIPIFGLEVY